MELAALTSIAAAADATVKASWPRSLHSDGPHAWVIRDRPPATHRDRTTDPRLPESWHAIARARGYRSLAFVPMLRHDEAVGMITLTRREAGGFSVDEIALLQTFAAQAVIAIENVRLFRELQARNAELTES